MLSNVGFCTRKSFFFINALLRMYSNLLSPAGVGLQDAVFTLNVYRAEDLPQSEFDLLRDFL